MALLQDIVTFFAEHGVIDGDGIDTFRDFQPDTPDNVISLHEYTGEGVSPLMSAVHRSVQIVVRNKNADAARTKSLLLCNTLRDAMGFDGRVDFTSTRWGQVYIRQTPYKFSQDERDRVLYGFNLGITTTIE